MGKDENGERLAKVKKLLPKLDEVRQQETALLEEIAAILSGEPGIGEKLKFVEGEYVRLWQARYRSPYQWRYTEDRPHLKRLIKALGTDEIVVRMTRYVADDTEFYRKARHPFGLFVRNVNEFSGEAALGLEADTASGPVGCRHAPRCGSDADCTAKMLAELRR